ncbi:MAG: hypothetical protein K8S15_13290 [Candidatus Aegiribacteria sp.]|nr:hypothetical protein [Candidatus Aegiribacteria sp.]
MGKLKLINNQLVSKEGLSKKKLILLDELRLLYVFFPPTLKSWFVVSSTSNIQWLNLDALSADEIERFSSDYDQLIKEEKGFFLSDIKLIMADFHNNYSIFTLKDFKKAGINIFSILLSYRTERLQRLHQWLQTDPQVQMVGVMSQKALVNSRGFRRGNKVLDWDDLETLKVNTANLSTFLLLIPKGVSTGMFSFKQYKYTIGISEKKKEYYVAECDFWHSMAKDSNIRN